ncbi:MAG TPA: hypothetical protein VHQ86_06120, partial [Candidatus Saccharimonadia bacterium]|nr:hypothetical protein [Candidatus Saccharimonadia bacterium]
FDTVSQTWVKADQGSFSCDTTTKLYMSPKYYYDSRIDWYEIIPAAKATNLPDYMVAAPNVVHTVIGDIVVGSQDYQVAQAMGLLTPGGGGILLPAASDASAGTASPATAGGGQSVFDLTNLVNVVNTLQSVATSGNVDATKNTSVGDSTTGAATVVANLINLLASAWSWSNGNLAFFMQTLLAPHTGDITLAPTETVQGGGGSAGGTTANIDGTGSGSNNTIGVNDPSSLTVNAQNQGNIINNVNVNAQSGDATATGNTGAGNVSTGNALAQVNIINLINSLISSGSSFFGIINIIGNLNGDILFPQGFLDGLVPASNTGGATTAGVGTTGADSNNTVGVDNSSTTTANNSSYNGVNNNIATTAASGSANLDSNTSAGSAQTGSAATNQNIFNLANNSIFGDNAVLVMVNVMGHWLGKIMTLPGTGSSQAALLTGNATANVNNTGADSNNQVNVNNPTTTNVNTNSTGTITNNVNVNAQSGDATASKNTQVGNVSTGNAEADIGVANLFNTIIGVKHWFGVLVINVFGDWVGDVNNDTDAGGFSTGAGRGGATPEATVAQTGTVPAVGLLALVKPVTSGGGAVAGAATVAAGTGAPAVLTAAAHLTPINAAAATKAKNMSLMFILSALVMLVAGALMTIDRKLGRR